MKVKIVNCEGCDGFSDLNYPKCKGEECPSEPKLMPIDPETGLVVFKNTVFTKLYYTKQNEYMLLPFFVDVILSPARGRTLMKYQLKDATVRIIKNSGDIQPTYSLTVPNLTKSFRQLWALFKRYGRIP